MKNSAIVILTALVIFLGWRLVVIENQRYAAIIGMCPSKDLVNTQDPVCLSSVQTRTSWAWHLFYAIVP